MDFSKFKFELYDILALLLPGFLSLCIGWVTLRGWHTFVLSLAALSGTGFTALLLAAFPLGHVIQELGDAALKKIRGERCFKSGRDKFWNTDEGRHLKTSLVREIGFEPSVDSAYDFCLHKTMKEFSSRRHAFLTTSDFCRSLLVLGFLVIPAIVRVIWDTHASRLQIILYIAAGLATWLLYLYLVERRMTRFRERSDTPVFRTYLSIVRAAHAAREIVELTTETASEEE